MAVSFQPWSVNKIHTVIKTVPQTTAQPVGTGVYDNLTIQASWTNAEIVYLGGDDRQDFELSAGSGHTFSHIDLAWLYVKKVGAGAAQVNVIWQDEP